VGAGHFALRVERCADGRVRVNRSHDSQRRAGRAAAFGGFRVFVTKEGVDGPKSCRRVRIQGTATWVGPKTRVVVQAERPRKLVRWYPGPWRWEWFAEGIAVGRVARDRGGGGGDVGQHPCDPPPRQELAVGVAGGYRVNGAGAKGLDGRAQGW